MRIDVHQHLWPSAFVEAMRRRQAPPRLAGWTLELEGEPPYDVRPTDHDVSGRAALAERDGVELVLVSLSSPLGIEWLPPDEAGPLLEAYHVGSLELPRPFGTWASACLTEIDPRALLGALDRGCVGLQLPATALLDAHGYNRCRLLLEVLEGAGRPLLVHPGQAGSAMSACPGPAWWAALVPYVQQMHQAWFAFRTYGRPRHPRLRVCFAILAGLAPLHGERCAARGGGRGEVDTDAFVETSSYGPRAIDATVRALGIDVIVHGSDRPYAPPPAAMLGDAAAHALLTTNPIRLLRGGTGGGG
ncbi:amidohydrolase [Candidatus Nephthysia bennettiae]|uniref:Amidohydrolase n=1 Tax=Candidatus Nephthysia bennettiae TaxID=3127016 RepID=A0A934K6W9_9BACT|nr:amidohydrolase [Candidatus Dormibacteraeota bacterium]MBJ7611034.1 amidohydrolase [Candidatus Dormibacteraeota bacterium]